MLGIGATAGTEADADAAAAALGDGVRRSLLALRAGVGQRTRDCSQVSDIRQRRSAPRAAAAGVQTYTLTQNQAGGGARAGRAATLVRPVTVAAQAAAHAQPVQQRHRLGMRISATSSPGEEAAWEATAGWPAPLSMYALTNADAHRCARRWFTPAELIAELWHGSAGREEADVEAAGHPMVIRAAAGVPALRLSALLDVLLSEDMTDELVWAPHGALTCDPSGLPATRRGPAPALV